jgi:hypothetical protein
MLYVVGLDCGRSIEMLISVYQMTTSVMYWLASLSGLRAINRKFG